MKKRDNQKPIINQSKLEKNSTRITTNCLRNLEPKKISESNKQKKQNPSHQIKITLRKSCKKIHSLFIFIITSADNQHTFTKILCSGKFPATFFMY